MLTRVLYTTVEVWMLIEYFSNKILKYICNKKVIDNDEIDVYKYGIEITLSSVLNIFLILIIAAATNTLSVGIVFLIVFISVRKYTGGFHADTYLTCNLTFVCCYMLVLILLRINFMQNVIIHISMILMCFLTILFLCPIENKNKKIVNKRKMKIISFFAYLFWYAVSVAFIYINPILSRGILFTLYLITGLAIIGFLKERRLL